MLSLSKFYNISIKHSSLCKTLPFADKQVWPIAMLRVPLLVGIHHYTRMTGVSGIAPITKVTWTPVHPNIIMQSKPYLILKGHKYHSFFLLSNIGHNDLFIVRLTFLGEVFVDKQLLFRWMNAQKCHVALLTSLL